MRVLAHIGYHKTGSSRLQRFVFEDPASTYASVGHETPEHPFQYYADSVRGELEELIVREQRNGNRRVYKQYVKAGGTASPVTERLCG